MRFAIPALLLATALIIGGCGDPGLGADTAASDEPDPTTSTTVTETSAPSNTVSSTFASVEPTLPPEDEWVPIAEVAPGDPVEDNGSSSTTTTTTETPPVSIVASDAFASIEGTPNSVFESFEGSTTVIQTIDDLAIEVTSEGRWTKDAYECTMTIGIGLDKYTQAIIATPESVWLDQGTGWNGPMEPYRGEDLAQICPAAPQFWSAFIPEPYAGALTSTEDFNGRQAARIESASLAGLIAASMGAEGFEITRMVSWVDVETRATLGFSMDAEVTDAEALAHYSTKLGEQPERVAISYEVSLDRINDPAISIEIPAG